MNLLSLISSCLFLSLTLISIPLNSAQCIDQPYPTQPNIKLASKCLLVKKQPMKNVNYQVQNDTNMFVIQFNCEIKDITRCAKVKSSFEEAGLIISSTLILNTPILINAKFREMESAGILGAAGPYRTMPMKDDDGFERLYPQSLVKQFQLSVHPEFAPVDIIADFNSLIPFWFEGDPPITSQQIGFLELIIHELMHGLGFASSWNVYLDNFPEAATPEIVGLTTGTTLPDLNAKFVFNGFQESAFDKYLILLPENKLISSYANELNKFADFGTTYENAFDFLNQFVVSPQFLVAKEIFSSSISHVDSLTYTNTSEFLMTFSQEKGRTLNDNIRIGGNYAGGAIGHKLRLILESLGYATKESPNYKSPSPPDLPFNEDLNSSSWNNFSYKFYHTFVVGITIIMINYL
ncbi:16926_t:CDS:2 [Funneliformis geosporum]|uniref:16926_t:CDS:1 n=1 Tax=Funneliformis geosporum TaxID=1117311 RepID=A0A9W4SGS0_9GLOM|nr:16926_t:CDS:2 [Funneliformis geosporum]